MVSGLLKRIDFLPRGLLNSLAAKREKKAPAPELSQVVGDLVALAHAQSTRRGMSSENFEDLRVSINKGPQKRPQNTGSLLHGLLKRAPNFWRPPLGLGQTASIRFFLLVLSKLALRSRLASVTGSFCYEEI